MDYGHELLFGTFITPAAERPQHAVELAGAADRAGLDLVTFQDHPYHPGFLDTRTLLTYVAARTSRVRLGHNVLKVDQVGLALLTTPGAGSCQLPGRLQRAPRHHGRAPWQVLVLAAQNAVDYRLLGVATSGATLFRQVGGSIGVSVFGAILANRLGQELAHRLPRGAHVPIDASPAAIEHLPTAINTVYGAAVAAALHPVFQTATAVMVVAFALSWRLLDVPLRETTQAPAGASERELRTLAGSSASGG